MVFFFCSGCLGKSLCGAGEFSQTRPLHDRRQLGVVDLHCRLPAKEIKQNRHSFPARHGPDHDSFQVMERAARDPNQLARIKRVGHHARFLPAHRAPQLFNYHFGNGRIARAKVNDIAHSARMPDPPPAGSQVKAGEKVILKKSFRGPGTT